MSGYGVPHGGLESFARKHFNRVPQNSPHLPPSSLQGSSSLREGVDNPLLGYLFFTSIFLRCLWHQMLVPWLDRRSPDPPLLNLKGSPAIPSSQPTVLADTRLGFIKIPASHIQNWVLFFFDQWTCSKKCNTLTHPITYTELAANSAMFPPPKCNEKQTYHKQRSNSSQWQTFQSDWLVFFF